MEEVPFKTFLMEKVQYKQVIALSLSLRNILQNSSIFCPHGLLNNQLTEIDKVVRQV